MTEKERRMLNDADISIRSTDDESESDVIEGYALKFNRWSEMLGGWFREIIEPNALDEADLSDVVALIDHETSRILGRSGVNLELEVDAIGLKYRIKPSATSYTKDLIENIRSGIISQSSFAMSEIEDDWEENENGELERTLRKIKKIWDVSPVSRPAYKDTDVSVGSRSMEKVEELKKEERDERSEIELLDLETEYLSR